MTILEDFYATPAKTKEDGSPANLGGTSVQLSEARALRQLVRDSGAVRTLEIGLAYGGSAIAICEGGAATPSFRHTALDPFQAEDFGNVALTELKRRGFSGMVDFHTTKSEIFLFDCAAQGRKFDLIFNDGNHHMGDVVTNAFFADRCIGPGGILAFHDALLPSGPAVAHYLVREQHYEVIPLPADSKSRRLLRMMRYGMRYNLWFARHIVPNTCCSLMALRKPGRKITAQA